MSAYSNARAFRVALEDRLRRLARDSGRPLDRLRKEAAAQRLLARLVAVAPPDDWALKGGLALVARLGEGARSTRDADTTWRGDVAALRDILDEAVDHDAGDWFAFEIGAGRDISAEGPEGGQRFPVLARLDGREFERFTLDVNLLPGDARPVERVALRNLFEFAGLDTVVVPMIPAAQQLAEKLHAYTRDYGEASSRAKDLHDLLVVALELPLPDLGRLAAVAQETFLLRRAPWPPQLLPPPAEWTGAWAGFVATFTLPWKTLDGAFAGPSRPSGNRSSPTAEDRNAGTENFGAGASSR